MMHDEGATYPKGPGPLHTTLLGTCKRMAPQQEYEYSVKTLVCMQSTAYIWTA